MAGELSLLLTAGGGYKNAPLTEEIWETTLRFAVVDGTVDDIGTFPTTLSVKPEAISRHETNWDIEGDWSIGDNITPNQQFHVDDWLNDQVAPAFSTWMSSGYLSGQCELRYLKAYPIGSPNGRAIPAPPQTQGGPITLTFTTTRPSGSGGAMCPAQDALVLSHRTGQRGRKGRGRMYQPAVPVPILEVTGVLKAIGVPDLLDRQVALLQGCSYTGTGPNLWNVRPVVTGKPYVNYGVITSVSVGRVLDTQQRRRNAISEDPQSAAVTY